MLTRINQETLKFFSSSDLNKNILVSLGPLDLFLKDLDPFIKDLNKENDFLKKIKQDLEILSEELISKKFLLKNDVEKLLTNQERLSKRLTAFQENKLFFQENAPFLNKITNIFLEISLNVFNKARACRDFIFYSLTTAALIKANIFFIKQFNPADWLDGDKDILNVIGHASVIALGVLSIGYAIVNARELIAHRNDEAKKQKELAAITEDDKSKFNLLLQQT